MEYPKFKVCCRCFTFNPCKDYFFSLGTTNIVLSLI